MSAQVGGCRTKSERAAWSRYSIGYEQKVFSFTSFKSKRRLLLEYVKRGVIADLGCGPLTFLLRDLTLLEGVRVVATDFCLDMILEARRSYQTECLDYLVADNRCLPLRANSIDTVISVNSILPEKRKDIDLMFSEIFRVLRFGGTFVAVLPAFEMSLVARDKWGMKVRIDLQTRREWDTSGWQSFHTQQDIETLVTRHDFSSYDLNRVVFDSPEEVLHIQTVYHAQLHSVPRERMSEFPLFEYLLVARK